MAQLILYPKYPEVRFSGFLQGCKAGPGALMADRQRARKFSADQKRSLAGRVLFLGTTNDRRVIGYVAAGDSPAAREFTSGSFPSAFVVFKELPLPQRVGEDESRRILLAELGRINRAGWIDSKQLDGDRQLKPCNAHQCGGFTLEAELGIAKNSQAEPDFLGWEVKQHAVSNFLKPETGGAITLMTPEPTVGFYKDRGPEAFLRRFGYPDKKGRPDRLNFGGIHKVGECHSTTCLTMIIFGFDPAAGVITDANGAVQLVSGTGEIAAAWPFAGLLAHWSRKHSKAVYVPSKCRQQPLRQYSYGSRVRLAQGTDPLRLLRALAAGAVFYDPGIKLEFASTQPRVKRRSQFRVGSKDLSLLYRAVELVDI